MQHAITPITPPEHITTSPRSRSTITRHGHNVHTLRIDDRQQQNTPSMVIRWHFDEPTACEKATTTSHYIPQHQNSAAVPAKCELVATVIITYSLRHDPPVGHHCAGGARAAAQQQAAGSTGHRLPELIYITRSYMTTHTIKTACPAQPQPRFIHGAEHQQNVRFLLLFINQPEPTGARILSCLDSASLSERERASGRGSTRPPSSWHRRSSPARPGACQDRRSASRSHPARMSIGGIAVLRWSRPVAGRQRATHPLIDRTDHQPLSTRASTENIDPEPACPPTSHDRRGMR